MKILMVLTSHDQLGNTGHKTGFWLEEFAAPYFVFRDAGVELTLASPKGGQPPIDPKSDLPENQTSAMARFKRTISPRRRSRAHQARGRPTADYSTVFYPGGHGPMWDLAESPASIALLESFYGSGKPIALVCHSPGVLRHVKYGGAPLVRGKRVTGFTNEEEAEVQLTKVVPFLVEDELKRLGARFEKVAKWQPFSIVDGGLVTGQNPASSTRAAQDLIQLLGVGAPPTTACRPERDCLQRGSIRTAAVHGYAALIEAAARLPRPGRSARRSRIHAFQNEVWRLPELSVKGIAEPRRPAAWLVDTLEITKFRPPRGLEQLEAVPGEDSLRVGR